MSMMFLETRHCGLCDVRPGPLETGLQYHCHPAKVSTTPPPPLQSHPPTKKYIRIRILILPVRLRSKQSLFNPFLP